MSRYEIEWPCCGDISVPHSWEPDECPFCEPSIMAAHRRMNAALQLIAQTEPVDAALDPQRLVGLARNALGAPQEPPHD